LKSALLSASNRHEAVGSETYPRKLKGAVVINPINRRKLFALLAVCALLLCAQSAGIAQKEEENSRRFWPPDFRPAAANPKPKPRTGKYNRVTPQRPSNPTLAPAQEAVLGVTLWLLRSPEETKQVAKPPVKEPDQTAQVDNQEAARVLVKKSNGKKEAMVAERVEANTAFREGQMLRLSIEVPQDGYLYVLDREKFADGKISDPYLVFPTNPRSNENLVKAGRIVELPDSEHVFEISRLSANNNAPLVGELLTFIVSPRPLEGLPRANPDDSPILLPRALVEDWEKKWAAQFEQLELEQGAGKARTKAEQQATESAGQTLTQDDPLPQTVFRLAVKRGNPFLVRFPLTIK
jgi:hypothetical protein